LPYLDTVHQDRQLANSETISHPQSAARAGSLPQVAWVAPNGSNSERPACADFQGPGVHHWVDQQLTKGSEWNSTTISLAWDDWGGLYDDVTPPPV